MRISKEMNLEVVQRSEQLRKRRLTPHEQLREKGIWISRIVDGQKVDIFIPWKKGQKGRYVDLTQKVKVVRVDWNLKEIECFLCGEKFHFDKEMERHMTKCEGNPGRFIDKFVKKELNKVLLGGVSEFVKGSGEFKEKGTTIIVKEIRNSEINKFAKMDRKTKKEKESTEGVSRMVELKEELVKLEKKYGKLV